MTDWSEIATQAFAAADGVLNGTWGRMKGQAEDQIKDMAAQAATMEADYLAVPPMLTADEYATLKAVQLNELQGLLSTDEAIGVLAAEQAADAAWSVIATALRASIPFA